LREQSGAFLLELGMTTTVIVEDDGWEIIADLDHLVQTAVAAVFPDKPCSVDVLLTSDVEVQRLNRDFRKIDKPTNVLSFPASLMPVVPGEMAHLGDIVMAYETVAREAKEQQKLLSHHVTHLVVHATLHLLGHDHENEDEADIMESKEREILAHLNIPDPYAA
jgi:probable rRNA maturation factor